MVARPRKRVKGNPNVPLAYAGAICLSLHLSTPPDRSRGRFVRGVRGQRRGVRRDRPVGSRRGGSLRGLQAGLCLTGRVRRGSIPASVGNATVSFVGVREPIDE